MFAIGGQSSTWKLETFRIWCCLVRPSEMSSHLFRIRMAVIRSNFQEQMHKFRQIWIKVRTNTADVLHLSLRLAKIDPDMTIIGHLLYFNREKLRKIIAALERIHYKYEFVPRYV